MKIGKKAKLIGILCAVAVVSTTALANPATAASKSKLLGIVSISANEANNARVIMGATSAAKAAGWKVRVIDAQGSAPQAIAAIKSLVTQKAGMIFDLVFPTTSIGAALVAAKKAGIPVATWGGGMGNYGNGVVMTTGDGGPLAIPSTNLLLKNMGNTGDILALTYRTGQVCRDREVQFGDLLAGKSGIGIQKNEVNIPGYIQDGARYTSAWLAGHPAGSGNLAIWGCWDDPTIGAISALKQAGRTDVKTYGMNGNAAAIAAVRDGSMTATVFQDSVKEGKTMFATTLKAMKAGMKWTAIDVIVPGILITKDNVDAFIAAHPDALK
jgi:ribose transport system substrate-binding protein